VSFLMVEGGSKKDTYSFFSFLKQLELCSIAKKKYSTKCPMGIAKKKYITKCPMGLETYS
jgi:hypothetical protein